MQVSPVRFDASPRGDGYRRTSVVVTYDDGAPADHLWIDQPIDTVLAPESGDPWLVALLPLAVTLGEPLEIAAPVDPDLLSNLAELQRVWGGWYPAVQPVQLICEARAGDGAAGVRAGGTGAMFSGGVDSFFTLLRDRAAHPLERRFQIDHLITVWGFDLPVDHIPAIDRLRARYRDLAAEFGVHWLDVATNLRQTRWREVDWAHLGHGCALASMCHALGGILDTVLIPSGSGYADVRPWASHPQTDPLLSSSRLRFVHDGATKTRVEKLEVIAEHPSVRNNLRVCFRSESDENCGGCPKCLRTMLTLDLLGALPEVSCFGDVSDIPVARARRLHCRWVWDFGHTAYVAELARDRGRTDLARALELAMRDSRRGNLLLDRLSGATRVRGLAWLPRAAERVIWRGWTR